MINFARNLTFKRALHRLISKLTLYICALITEMLINASKCPRGILSRILEDVNIEGLSFGYMGLIIFFRNSAIEVRFRSKTLATFGLQIHDV